MHMAHMNIRWIYHIFSQVNVNSGLISMNTVIEGPDILEYENTKSSNMESAR